MTVSRLSPAEPHRSFVPSRDGRSPIAVAALLAAALTLPSFAGESVSRRAAVATSSPLATRAATEVLQAGGNAIDAAVAAAFLLAVAEPQSAGLGGGGFLTCYDAKSGAVWTLDFRERAASSAKAAAYRPKEGEPAPREGAYAAVPGTVAGLAEVHRKFGTQKWSALLAPAVAAAREGIDFPPRLAHDLATAKSARNIDRFAATAGIFFPKPDGNPPSRLLQPELASTLERIARSGGRDFYDGQTARKIVATVQKEGGDLQLLDLREYQAVWRAPIEVAFGPYRIVTVPPPSSGGLVLAESLAIIGGLDLAALERDRAPLLHLLAEATRRGFIDANLWAADPDRSRIPFKSLMSAERAAAWRKTIDPARATPSVQLHRAVPESKHTTHLSIVDTAGNAVSLTLSLGDDFGSGIVVEGGGFFMNGSMRDFQLDAVDRSLAGLVPGDINGVEGGKRMATPIAPTIIFRDGVLFMVAGSSGGNAIPSILLKLFVDVAVKGAAPLQAVEAARFHQQANPDLLSFERDRAAEGIEKGLQEMGHQLHPVGPMGIVALIVVDGDRYTAIADPRGGGAAGGF